MESAPRKLPGGQWGKCGSPKGKDELCYQEKENWAKKNHATVAGTQKLLANKMIMSKKPSFFLVQWMKLVLRNVKELVQVCKDSWGRMASLLLLFILFCFSCSLTFLDPSILGNCLSLAETKLVQNGLVLPFYTPSVFIIIGTLQNYCNTHVRVMSVYTSLDILLL